MNTKQLPAPYVETGCTLTFRRKSYTMGGSYFAFNRKTGKHEGMVYGDWNDSPDHVSNWHGDLVIPATYGPIWVSNMGDKRRSVRFTYAGITFAGIWYAIENNQCIKVREVKP